MSSPTVTRSTNKDAARWFGATPTGGVSPTVLSQMKLNLWVPIPLKFESNMNGLVI